MKKLITALIVVCVVGFLFFPYFKSKEAPVPIDIPIGMYYPWLNHSFGYAVRPPVKNSLISDTVSQFWIWRNWGITGLQEGRLNIWNPYSFSGYEMSPWFHTILFSPLNIFYAFLSRIDAMSMIVIFQIIISLLGCYLLGSKIFSSSICGWALAIGWTMSSYFTGWLTWGTISVALAAIPWTLYFFENYNTVKHKNISIILCLLSLVFLILSGHPQTIGYGLGIFYIWTVIRLIGSRRKIIFSFLFPLTIIVLSIIITGPAIFPSIGIIGNSIRSFESLAGVHYGFIPWNKIVTTLLSVNAFGNPSSGNYFGGDYNFQEKLVNFGIIPLFFAVYQIIKTLKRKNADSLTLIGIFLVLIGLLISTEYPFGFLIYLLKIPLLSSSPAGRGMIVAIFGGIILFSLGIKDVLMKKIDLKSAILSTIFIGVSYITIYLTLLVSLFIIKTSPLELIGFYQNIKVNLMITARNTVFPFMFFLFLAIGIFIIKKFSKLRYIFVGVVLVLAFFEGYLFFKKVTPFVPKGLFFPETPSIKFILEQQTKSSDIFRFERESGELLPPNMWEIFKFYSTSGYDPIAPLQYEKYMVSKEVHGNISRYFENGAAIDRLDGLGVKYFMSLKRNSISVPDENGKISDRIDQKTWKPVFSEGPVVILENKNYKPPYFLTNNEIGNSILLTKKTDNLWEFKVKTSSNNQFVLMENYSPHWKALVDDIPVKIEAYQQTFKMVEIVKGEHSLKFIYENPNLLIGAYLAFAGIILSFLLILLVDWYT